MAFYTFNRDIRSCLSPAQFNEVKEAIEKSGGAILFGENRSIIELPDNKHYQDEEETLLLDCGVVLNIYAYPTRILSDHIVKRFDHITKAAREVLTKDEDNMMYGDQWVVFDVETEMEQKGDSTIYTLYSDDKLEEKGSVLDVFDGCASYRWWSCSPDVEAALVAVGGRLEQERSGFVTYRLPNDQHIKQGEKVYLRSGKVLDIAYSMPTSDASLRQIAEITEIEDDARTALEEHGGAIGQGWVAFPDATFTLQRTFSFTTYTFAGHILACRFGKLVMTKLATVLGMNSDLAGKRVLVLGDCGSGCHWYVVNGKDVDMIEKASVLFDPPFQIGDRVNFKGAQHLLHPSLHGCAGVVECLADGFVTARYSTGGFTIHRLVAPVDQFKKAA